VSISYQIDLRIDEMDRNLLIGGIFVVLLIVVAVYISQDQESGKNVQKSTTYYVINYNNGTNISGIGLGELLSNGSYMLSDGTIIPASDVLKIIDKYEGRDGACCGSRCPLTYQPVCGADGNTYINLCAAALANVQTSYSGACNGSGICERPCIEPKPELRFVCKSGQVVKNRVDCQGNESCSYVKSKYYVCPDGTKVKEPDDCVISSVAAFQGATTVYVCSDGSEASSESDCSADCYPTSYAAAPVSSNNGTGGVIGTVYECWDGMIVKGPAECEPYCNRSCVCTYEYSPVCVNGRTYSNPCLARCDGYTNYTDGECEPECANVGERCVVPSLAYVSSTSDPRCCEEGSYCSSEGICTANQCKKVDESCTRPNVTYTASYVPSLQGDCCDGLICDENSVCSNRSSCGTSGTMCGWSTSLAAAPSYYGACCEGYTCDDNTCVLEECLSELGSCQIDSDCCSGLECSKFGQCKKPCINEGYSCNASSECCGDLVCTDNLCTQEEEVVPGDLCSGPTNPQWGLEKSCATGYYDGVWGTYCGFCADPVTEGRYYCLMNSTYTLSAMPVLTLTDQVGLVYKDCIKTCSGGSCQ